MTQKQNFQKQIILQTLLQTMSLYISLTQLIVVVVTLVALYPGEDTKEPYGAQRKWKINLYAPKKQMIFQKVSKHCELFYNHQHKKL